MTKETRKLHREEAQKKAGARRFVEHR